MLQSSREFLLTCAQIGIGASPDANLLKCILKLEIKGGGV